MRFPELLEMGKSPVHGKLHRAERSNDSAKMNEKYVLKSRIEGGKGESRT